MLALVSVQFCAHTYADLHAPPFLNNLVRDSNNNMGIGMALNNRRVPASELEAKFWQNQASNELLKKLNQQMNKNKAKNVIFFLGDGMPISSITAARILHGQRVGYPGEEQLLSFEKFPYSGLSRVSTMGWV